MVKGLKVYIAGALSQKELTERNPSEVVVDYISNVSIMCKAAVKVREKGHYPYVPGLDFLLGFAASDWGEEDYRGIGVAFLEVCDAVLIISWSWGVEKEVDRARLLGIPVFTDIEDLPGAGEED